MRRLYFVGCLALSALMVVWLSKNGVKDKLENLNLYFPKALDVITVTRVLPTKLNFTEVNKKRVDDLRRKCKEQGNFIREYQPIGLYYMPGFTRWMWMKSEKHNLFYCAAPKCASSTWKHNLLMEYGISSDKDTSHTLAITQLSLDAYLKNNSIPIKTFFDNLNEIHRLLIVRNPWRRVVSTYLDKVVNGNMTLRDLCRGKENSTGKVTPTFEQFFDCIIQRPMSGYSNNHVHPVSDLCAVCRIDYNIIVKQEELLEFTSALRKRLGMTMTEEATLRKSSYANSLSKFYKNISEWKLDRFRDLYKYDIRLFGYPNKPV